MSPWMEIKSKFEGFLTLSMNAKGSKKKVIQVRMLANEEVEE